MNQRTSENSSSRVMQASPDWGPVLVVDDDPGFRRILETRLRGHGFRVIVAEDGQEGLGFIRELQPDVVISDWMMPRLDGLALCQTVRSDPALQAAYVILLSNRSEVDEMIKGLEAGADDYLGKNCSHEELIARVRAGMRIRALQRELVRQATHDAMTGLSNRAHFFERLEDEMRRATRYGSSLALAMIDLDGLKGINDTWGHLAGDAAIKRAASVISRHHRETDVAARYGGDEFAMLFIDADRDKAGAAMKRISVALDAEPVLFGEAVLPVSLSYGIAEWSASEPCHPDQFVQAADRRLYQMKRSNGALVRD